jgi:hypothetical protein
MTKHMRPPFGVKSKPIALLAATLLLGTINYAQTIESVTFSAVASSNDNFQPVMGTPYGASLSGANGSLEISASYGQSAYEETTLSIEEVKFQSSIRVFPNPTTYLVSIDLSELPQGEHQLYLVDLNGKTTYSHSTKATIEQIDLSTYPTGTYVLKVQTKGTKQITNFKIVKTK